MRYSDNELIIDGLLELKQLCDDEVTLLELQEKLKINNYNILIFKAKTKQKAVNDLLKKRLLKRKKNRIEMPQAIR